MGTATLPPCVRVLYACNLYVVPGIKWRKAMVPMFSIDTCPRQEVSGNRGDPGVGVLYGTKSVLI